jgi:hypothetical protein
MILREKVMRAPEANFQLSGLAIGFNLSEASSGRNVQTLLSAPLYIDGEQ